MSIKHPHDTPILERRFVPKDQVIFREGDAGYVAYLIQSGGVKVFSLIEGREVTLAKLGVGDIFGETALIFETPRTASVRATEDSHLIEITRLTLDKKLRNSDPTIRAIVRMLSQRLVKGNNTLLGKKDNLEDLQQVISTIYDNILQGLPPFKQREFRDKALPAVESFMKVLDEIAKDEAMKSDKD
ncbi:MAG: Crp/Fnr family transcriptional regulator [Pseudobdellovibrionaceae bacterium]